jgi:hypothetical protein
LAEWNVSERAKDGPVEHELLDGWGLLALQGTSYIERGLSKKSSPGDPWDDSGTEREGGLCGLVGVYIVWWERGSESAVGRGGKI